MESVIRILKIIFAFLLLILIFGFGFHAGKRYDIALDENDQYVAISYSVNEQKMRRLMSLIDNHYVDQIHSDTLFDNTIAYVMSKLDPHSVYLNRQSSGVVNQEMKGYFVGVGINYVTWRDTLYITSVHPQSVNRERFITGDRILSINGVDVTGPSANQAAHLLQGEIDSQVQITLLRNDETINTMARRLPITQNSVSMAYMLTDQVGYIKLTRFGENSYYEFRTALLTLKNQGMQALVFDLRGNPGGVMKVAEQIADEFLKENQLIVYTVDKDGKKQMRYATRRGDFEDNPVYVLIDEGSASASEIIAGALQDNDIGVVIGRRSYGKGLVQRQISLGDGSQLRLTTARYYTPTGRSIQKPYLVEPKDYSADIVQRYKRGEMFSRDSIKTVDSLRFVTPGGKVLYGGGGIIPDEFIPIDTINYGKWFYEHAHNNLFQEKIIEHIEENKQNFNVLTEKHFIDYYNVEQFSQQLLEAAGVPSNRFTELQLQNFNTFVKAELAKHIYGTAAYDHMWNLRDAMITRALELYNEEHP
ncbi:MAG: S41 family peptidase [Weeksellaceae bacterium]|nr:S41 family peptidase [Weeksellaceae bacterium]